MAYDDLRMLKSFGTKINNVVVAQFIREIEPPKIEEAEEEINEGAALTYKELGKKTISNIGVMLNGVGSELVEALEQKDENGLDTFEFKVSFSDRDGRAVLIQYYCRGKFKAANFNKNFVVEEKTDEKLEFVVHEYKEVRDGKIFHELNNRQGKVVINGYDTNERYAELTRYE